MMKILRPILFAFGLALLLSSCYKRNIFGIVHRNCTGTYIKFDERFYRVGNKDILQDFQSGEMVEVSFRTCNDCFDEDEIICMMAMEYESVIEILSVH